MKCQEVLCQSRIALGPATGLDAGVRSLTFEELRIPFWLVNSPPILEPILVVGLGCSLGYDLDFDPWPTPSSEAGASCASDSDSGRTCSTLASASLGDSLGISFHGKPSQRTLDKFTKGSFWTHSNSHPSKLRTLHVAGVDGHNPTWQLGWVFNSGFLQVQCLERCLVDRPKTEPPPPLASRDFHVLAS